MRNPFVRGIGGVLSADIAVPEQEHELELRFYSKILTTGSAPLWREDLSNNRGTPIIGLGVRSPEYSELPMQWMPHIQVSDVGSSVARALELGGCELIHSRDEEGRSEWAVLKDPIGAAFGLVPVVEAESGAAGQVEGIGRISWLTLVVPDVQSTCSFYERVVGWSPAATGVDDGFEMRRPEGGAAAALRNPQDELAEIPPVWILSLTVDGFDESIRRVRDGGGEVVRVSSDARDAVIRDPSGAFIAVRANK